MACWMPPARVRGVLDERDQRRLEAAGGRASERRGDYCRPDFRCRERGHARFEGSSVAPQRGERQHRSRAPGDHSKSEQ